jgi:TolA-binding protein
MLGSMPGCATSGANAGDVAALKEEVATLRRERQVDEKRLQVLENQFDAEQAELQHLRGQGGLEGLPPSLRVVHLERGAHAPALPTKVQLRDPDEADLARLDELLGHGFPTAADSSGSASGGAPDALFDGAFEKLKTGDLVGAASDFQTFAEKFPKNTAADNALLDEGIAMYGQHHYAEALKVLSRIEARYPAGDAVPEAIWRAADCEEKLGHPEDARKRLTHLAKDFPASPEGSRARDRLQALAAKPGASAAGIPADVTPSSVADSHEGGSP